MNIHRFVAILLFFSFIVGCNPSANTSESNIPPKTTYIEMNECINGIFEWWKDGIMDVFSVIQHPTFQHSRVPLFQYNINSVPNIPIYLFSVPTIAFPIHLFLWSELYNSHWIFFFYKFPYLDHNLLELLLIWSWNTTAWYQT